MGRSPQRYPTTTKVESHEAWREHLAVSPATSPQAIPMAAHAEQPVHPRQPDCHTLMASVTGPAAPAHPRGGGACGPPFSAQPPTRPRPGTGGTGLGVPAEGTGVPRGPPATAPPAVRRGTGPTHPTQPAAVVTGLSPSAPDPRTPPA